MTENDDNADDDDVDGNGHLNPKIGFCLHMLHLAW